MTGHIANILYFFYGLSFFALGLALIIKNVPASLSFIKTTKIYGGVFAIIHSFSQWLAMSSIIYQGNEMLLVASHLFLSLSFWFMLYAGLDLLKQRYKSLSSIFHFASFCGALLIIISWLFVFLSNWSPLFAEALARWFVGIPAGILISLGIYDTILKPDAPMDWLNKEHASKERINRFGQFGEIKTPLAILIGTILLFGLSQCLGPSLPYFPFAFINADVFLSTTGLDIELVRMASSYMATPMALLVLSRFHDIEWNDLETKVEERTTKLRDVNKDLKKALLKAESAVTAKSNFLASMSHELRTPLNAIIGYSELLDLTIKQLDEKQSEQLGYIRESGRLLLKLVDDVLDMTAVERSLLALDVKDVDPEDVIRSLIGQTAHLAAENGITLSALPSTGTEKQLVRADAQRLVQILINLVSNAIKYNRINGSVSVGYEIAQKDFVEFSVSDTGYGIDDEQAERIFELFQRAENDAYLANKGLGIGLAISKALTFQMNGSIGFENLPEGGCRFWVVLPKASKQ